MKKKFRILLGLLIIGFLVIGSQSFNLTKMAPEPIPAPQGTVISVTDCNCLDFYYEEDNFPTLNADREMKVTFFGAVYSSGNDQSDGNSPWYKDPFLDGTNAFQCEDFYYQDGRVAIWTRENSSSSWVYQGDMFMSSSNCVMDGLRVLSFTVDCDMLANP